MRTRKPIYHVIERLRRETHEIQEEQLSPDEDYVKKIISFSFFIRLFWWAKNYPGEIHNGEPGGYEKMMQEFSENEELKDLVNYWEDNLLEYGEVAEREKKRVWGDIKEIPPIQISGLASKN